MRIVGIDFGLKRIGIAISDVFESFALPLTKIDRVNDDEKNAAAILKALENYPHIEKFVVGLPIYLSGDESAMTKDVRNFASNLEKYTGIPVVLLDERLTSRQAENLLKERSMKRKKRAQVVDILSAAIILQTFLDMESCNKT